MLKILLMLMFISTNGFSAESYEFKHFKITPKFERRVNSQDISEASPLMQKIKTFLQENGRSLINKITADLLEYNQEFPLGHLNSPIMNSESSLGTDIGLKLSRRVDPIFNSEKWRVFDRLTITIKAGAFLKNLRSNGEIEISDKELNLFAGVTFSRSYTYDHFADSYFKGLKGNIDKLIFGFIKYMGVGFTNIEPGEVISKTDMMSIGAELSTQTPSVYMMSGYGKTSIYFSKFNTVSYHRPLPEYRTGESDDLRASRKISKIIGSSLELGLQADFYKILRVTLLGMEYNVNFNKDQITNLTFSESDLIDIKVDKHLQAAIKKLNKGKDPKELERLLPYVTSTERGNRVSEELNLFALVWGKHFGSATERIVFDNYDGRQYFRRYYQEKATIVKSFWQTVFSSRNVSKFSKREVENLVFEFKAPDDETDFEDIVLNDASEISFRVSKEYQARNSKKKYQRQALKVIKDFETIDGGIIRGIQDGTLLAPFVIDMHAAVNKVGINYLMQGDEESLKQAFGVVCSGIELDFNRKIKRSVNNCINALRELYIKINVGDGKIHLESLRAFLKRAADKARSFKAFKYLFGRENIHLYGYIATGTPDNKAFRSFFSEGNFQGHGLIKDYVRNTRK